MLALKRCSALLPSVLSSFQRPLSSLKVGPDLQDFFLKQTQNHTKSQTHTPCAEQLDGLKPSVFIKTYGCQMNVSDTELIRSVLNDAGYAVIDDESKAKVVLLNTCAIRDAAEQKVWGKVRALQTLSGEKRTVGVLGCMAERLKEKLLDSSLVQIVAGPDAYRDLPRLLDMVQSGYENAINVQLSADETYADISPVRPSGAHSAFLSIMRGCSNLCSFCIVPYGKLLLRDLLDIVKSIAGFPSHCTTAAVRGRERSRPMSSILVEVQSLSQAGVKEVTLLGQNVNSYSDFSGADRPPHDVASASKWYAAGFQTVYKPNRQGAVVFAELLDRVAEVDPNMRIRFTSPHPKDFTDDVLEVVAKHNNVCTHLHMPAQSGSTAMLEKMRRGYTREAYDALLERASNIVPGATFSTDIIVGVRQTATVNSISAAAMAGYPYYLLMTEEAKVLAKSPFSSPDISRGKDAGFCGETDEDHAQTIQLLDKHKYSAGFMFAYSDRERTHAARHYVDDVPPEVKKRRLAEALEVFKRGVTDRRKALIGSRQLVLVEGPSKKGHGLMFGRTEGFQSLQIPCSEEMPDESTVQARSRLAVMGDYVDVDIIEAQDGRLEGRPRRICTLPQFFASKDLSGSQAMQLPFEPQVQNVLESPM